MRDWKDWLITFALLVPLYVIAATMSFMAIESYVHQGDEMTMTVEPPPIHPPAQSWYKCPSGDYANSPENCGKTGGGGWVIKSDREKPLP